MHFYLGLVTSCIIVYQFRFGIGVQSFSDLGFLGLFLHKIADITNDEKGNFSKAFQELGVQPKTDTSNDSKDWLQANAKAQGAGETSVNVLKETLPRIPIFSGPTPSKADHVSYEVWRFEVKCLQNSKGYKEQTLLQAARASLRGEASQIAVRLGTSATLTMLLAKLEQIYGCIEPGEDVLARFYSAKQGADETVVQWACRIEQIMTLAFELKKVTPDDAPDRLRQKLWSGLKQQLKDVSGHKFDSIKDYDTLLVEIRKLEQAHHPEPKAEAKSVAKSEHKAKTKVCQLQEGKEIAKNDGLAELVATVQQLSQKMEQFESKLGKFGSKPRTPKPRYNNDFNKPQPRKPVTCWRCGGGHVKKGCRAFQGNQGNENAPADKGQP